MVVPLSIAAGPTATAAPLPPSRPAADVPLPPPRPSDVPVATASPAVPAAVRRQKDSVAEMRVGGQIFTEWTSVDVSMAWDGEMRDFTFTAAGATDAGKSVDTGLPVQINLNGEQVINGFIEARIPSFNKEGHSVVLKGRSLTGAVIDSSVPLGTSYKDNALAPIARSLLKPHGVGFVVESAPPGFDKPFPHYAPRPGASVWSEIERLARMRGVVLSDDAQGNMVARRAIGTQSQPVADLVEGENILEAAGVFRDDKLMSKIKAVGTIKGTDDIFPTRDNSATRTNEGVRPNRTTVVLAEHAADREDLQMRADMEAARGIWTAIQITIVVQGWKRPDGELWKLTDHVSVRSPMLFLKNDPVVLGTAGITFTQGPRGTLTVLTLILPAYLSEVKRPGVSGEQSDILEQKDTPAKADSPDTESKT